MQTILLAWNPERFPWGSIDDELEALRREGKADLSWSVGSSKKPKPGDRAFLIRLGAEPKGIVAAGWIVSAPFEDRHWDPGKAAEGETARYVSLVIEYLSEEPVIPWERLQKAPLAAFRWSIQMSGIQLPPGIGEALEREWARGVPAVGLRPSEAAGRFLEGRRREARISRPERNPQARAVCLAHHGLACVCCGLEFAAKYGSDAAQLVVAHHLDPLGRAREEREVDPVRDLRPVCPNCHAVVHLREPPLTIEEVRARLRRPRRAP